MQHTPCIIFLKKSQKVLDRIEKNEFRSKTLSKMKNPDILGNYCWLVISFVPHFGQMLLLKWIRTFEEPRCRKPTESSSKTENRLKVNNTKWRSPISCKGCVPWSLSYRVTIGIRKIIIPYFAYIYTWQRLWASDVALSEMYTVILHLIHIVGGRISYASSEVIHQRTYASSEVLRKFQVNSDLNRY